MTIIEKKGSLRGRSLTMHWAYAASYQKPISRPPGPGPGGNALRHERQARPSARVRADGRHRGQGRGRCPSGRGGGLELRLDAFDAASAAPTSSTPRAGARCSRPGTTRTGADQAAQYTDWMVTDERRMALAAEAERDIYMHPLPADRNVEVADAVIDGPQFRSSMTRPRRTRSAPEGRHGPHRWSRRCAHDPPSRHRHRGQLPDQRFPQHMSVPDQYRALGGTAATSPASSRTAGPWPSVTATARSASSCAARSSQP